MDNCRYVQPQSLTEVPEILASLTDRSVILAGGTDLLISIREKRPDIDICLSLFTLPELRRVEMEAGWLSIGTMVTHTAASEHPLIQKYAGALAMACASVGSKQVRNKGTVGGSVMNGSVASDVIPCLCLLRGELEFLTLEGNLRIPVMEYLEDRRRWQQSRALLTAVRLPVEEGTTSCFLKQGSRPQVTIAQISLCASWSGQGEKKREFRMVMGAVSALPRIYEPDVLDNDGRVNREKVLTLAGQLREEIAAIRMSRKRPSKLKFTPAEQLYKERAVKGVLLDLFELIDKR